MNRAVKLMKTITSRQKPMYLYYVKVEATKWITRTRYIGKTFTQRCVNFVIAFAKRWDTNEQLLIIQPQAHTTHIDTWTYACSLAIDHHFFFTMSQNSQPAAFFSFFSIPDQSSSNVHIFVIPLMFFRRGRSDLLSCLRYTSIYVYNTPYEAFDNVL